MINETKNSFWKDSLKKRRDMTFKMEQENYKENPSFPRELILDINNRCNHKCYFCANPKIEKYEKLDFALAVDLMKQAKDLGSTDLGLQATGEPFIDKRLADFVLEGKKIGFKYVYLNTNGALASPQRAKPVIDAGCDSIKFSINAHNKEEFKIVHGHDDFDKVLENLKWIYNYRNQTNSKMGVYVSSVTSSKAKIKHDNSEKTITENCDNFDIRDVSNQGGSMMELNENEKIYEGNILGSLKKEEYTSRCVYPFNRIVINPYGNVVACTADFHNKLEIGDTKKHKLIDIWNSDEFSYFRKKHLSNNYKSIFCDKCLNNVNCKSEKLLDAYKSNL